MSEDADRLVRRFADAAGMSTEELLAQILAGRFEEEAVARAAETLAAEEDDGELEEGERWSEAIADETDDTDDDAAWWT
ncbi:MAG: hypothetical protein QOJ47_1681 [Gaiellales bacterium]|jgi:hypothetical protein|nr:hypothetical protein [Gaiellales bacterium]MDX6580132.1 hypothetical protein [Gaiellales bacterium]